MQWGKKCNGTQWGCSAQNCPADWGTRFLNHPEMAARHDPHLTRLPLNISFQKTRIVIFSAQDGGCHLYIVCCSAAARHSWKLMSTVRQPTSCHRMPLHAPHGPCTACCVRTADLQSLQISGAHGHCGAIWDQNARHIGIQSPRCPHKSALADGHLPSAHYPTATPL